MKKIGLVGIIAGALSAGMIGLSVPAYADDDDSGSGGRDRDSNYYDRGSNNPWVNQLIPTVKVPKVDTSVRN